MAYVKLYGRVCDIINCQFNARHVVVDKDGNERYYYCDNHRMIAVDIAHNITKAEYLEKGHDNSNCKYC